MRPTNPRRIALILAAMTAHAWLATPPVRADFVYTVAVPDFDGVTFSDSPNNHMSVTTTFPIPITFEFGTIVASDSQTGRFFYAPSTEDWTGVYIQPLDPTAVTGISLTFTVGARDALDTVSVYRAVRQSDGSWMGIFSSLPAGSTSYALTLFPNQTLAALELDDGGRFSSFGPIVVTLNRPADPPVAVPEPGSWTMLGMGGLGLAVAARVRRWRTAG